MKALPKLVLYGIYRHSKSGLEKKYSTRLRLVLYLSLAHYISHIALMAVLYLIHNNIYVYVAYHFAYLVAKVTFIK